MGVFQWIIFHQWSRLNTSIAGEVYDDTELSDGEIICFKTRRHDKAVDVDSGDIVISDDFIGYRLGTKKTIKVWEEYLPQGPKTNLSRIFLVIWDLRCNV